MFGRVFRVVALAVVLVLAAFAVGTALAQTNTASAGGFKGLDAGVENVIIWTLQFLIGIAIQKSSAWNEIIPIVRYVVALLAHAIGVPAAQAAADATLALPGNPFGAATLDTVIVTAADALFHKILLRLPSKLLHIKLPSWL